MTCDAQCKTSAPHRTLGQDCDGFVTLCGGAGETCQGKKCCRTVDAACGADTDCCGTAKCLSGRCQVCMQRAAGCKSDVECCSTDGCRDNGDDRGRVCSAFCSSRPGTGCGASGRGVCADGTWRCELTGSVCVPGTPTPETCNGLDDDCDGAVDEGLERSGTRDVQYPKGRGCAEDFRAPCTWECRRGNWVCEPVECVGQGKACDFCTGCTGDYTCGWCTNCVNHPCPPNLKCVTGDGVSFCTPQARCIAQQAPACYLPEQTGACVPPTQQ